MKIKLSAPTFVSWAIALILGLVAILMVLGVIAIPPLAPHSFWILAVAWILLVAATYLKGL